MKAIVVTESGGPDVLKVQNINKPEIASTEVLIKVKATSVNFADVLARRNKKEDSNVLIPGLDCSGIIEDVGAQVKSFKKGQRVVAFPKGGSYAEFVKADEELVYVIPDNIDFTIATASLLVGVTAYNTIVKAARLSAGETILVHAAAGGIGTTAIQIAKKNGASKIIGTVGSNEKKSIAKEAGADEVINYQEENFSERVLSITANKGVDVILDTIAGENFEKGIDCLSNFGRIITFGHVSGTPGKVMTDKLHSSSRSVIGYSTIAYRDHRPLGLKEGAEEILKLLEDGSLKMIISKTYEFSQASEAHALIESRQSTGKILLKP